MNWPVNPECGNADNIMHYSWSMNLYHLAEQHC